MRYGPLFRYAPRPGGGRVAYQVVGDGALDLVFLFGWPTHLGLMWENPSFAAFLGKLSSFSRLLLYDRLGNGLSDRGLGGYVFEDEMDDVRAVLAAVGSERAALFGCHVGGRLALLLAATYPDQVSAVVTFGSHPATLRDADYPWGSTVEEHEGVLAMIRASSTPEDPIRLLGLAAPREVADRSVRQWWRIFYLSAATRPRPTGPSGPSARWTSAACSARSSGPCWCCTGPETRRPGSRPAATWPSGFPAPAWWSCPATTTSPSSATRTGWPR